MKKSICLFVLMTTSLCLYAADTLTVPDRVTMGVQQEKLTDLQRQIDNQEHTLDDKMDLYLKFVFGAISIVTGILYWLGKKEIRNIAKELSQIEVRAEIKRQLSEEMITAKLTEFIQPVIDKASKDLDDKIAQLQQMGETKTNTAIEDMKKEMRSRVDSNLGSQAQKDDASEKGKQAVQQIKEGSDTEAVITFLYGEAIKVFNTKDYSAALNYFTNVLQLTKDNALAYFYRGFCNNVLKNYDAAIQDYTRSLALNPNDGNAHYNLAIILADHSADKAGAKLHYEKAIELNTKDYEAEYGLGLLLRTYFNDKDGAKLHYENAIALSPQYANAHYNLSLVLMYDFADKDGAKAHYETACQLNPALINAELDKAFNFTRQAATPPDVSAAK